jgi:1-acyl-sn-glycerol-3-phosphate acyltransferase
MSNDESRHEMAKFDPEFAAQVAKWAGSAAKAYFRAEVRGLDNFPATGAALAVANHSGGMLTPDVIVLAPEFYKKFGYDRPMYTLAHYGVVMGPLGNLMGRVGVIEASRESAAAALHDGAIVLVFPGGDYDAYRPTFGANTIDFNGRTGYIRTAIEAGVPIVPIVSIGAQESQLFLTRGNWLAKRLGLNRARMDILPFSVGFPFGVSMLLPPNMPFPSKIVTEVLQPIEICARFGDDPDIAEVDAHVRQVMQTALDGLARQRRLPIIG